MRILEPHPVELDVMLERRRALDQDRFDEVWAGEYHVVPAPSGPHSALEAELIVVLNPLARAAGLFGSSGFNLGSGPNDYRVPDLGYHRARLCGTWFSTAAIVVEILSPGDETWAKFDFYAAHGVDEICVADPRERTLRWFIRNGDRYVPVERSSLLAVPVADVVARIDWPG